jgi:cytochrome c-type biogenesis protein CcmH
VRRFLVALVILLALGAQVHAVEPSEELANPALEARARAIGSELRCVVCQNESIEESPADLAHDLRVLVRQQLVAGDTDAQVIQYIVDRYGQFVLLKPPVEPATYALWFGPGVVLLLAGLGIALYLRRRQPRPDGAAPLSEAERRRLERLLAEGDG